jgi:hypothetical protein
MIQPGVADIPVAFGIDYSDERQRRTITEIERQITMAFGHRY